jgi:hypothetical protein
VGEIARKQTLHEYRRRTDGRVSTLRVLRGRQKSAVVVDERLALAGLRLAALLNEVFGHVSPQEFRH